MVIGQIDAVLMGLTIPGGMSGRAAMDGSGRRDPEALRVVVDGYSRDRVMPRNRETVFFASLTEPSGITLGMPHS